MKQRVLISVDSEVHRRVRVTAIQLGVSVSNMYETGALALLNKSEEKSNARGSR